MLQSKIKSNSYCDKSFPRSNIDIRNCPTSDKERWVGLNQYIHHKNTLEKDFFSAPALFKQTFTGSQSSTAGGNTTVADCYTK